VNFLYLISFISFPKEFRTERDQIIVLLVTHVTWVIYLFFIIAPDAIFFAVTNFVLMMFFFFFTSRLLTRYFYILRFLFSLTVCLMIITLMLNLFNYYDLSNTIKSATLLPTVDRTETLYNSGAVLPLIFGEFAYLFNRNVLFFDQPSTFALFFFTLILGMKLSRRIRYSLIYTLFLFLYTPSKIAVLYLIVSIAVDLGIFKKKNSEFLRIMIPISSLLYIILVGKYMDIPTLDYDDTFSSRFYWTYQLATNFQLFSMEGNCISTNTNLCVFTVYDGFALKVPLLLVAAFLLKVNRYYEVTVSLILSLIVSVQYGVNMLVAPIWIILFVSSINNSMEGPSVDKV